MVKKKWHQNSIFLFHHLIHYKYFESCLLISVLKISLYYSSFHSGSSASKQEWKSQVESTQFHASSRDFLAKWLLQNLSSWWGYNSYKNPQQSAFSFPKDCSMNKQPFYEKDLGNYFITEKLRFSQYITSQQNGCIL